MDRREFLRAVAAGIAAGGASMLPLPNFTFGQETTSSVSQPSLTERVKAVFKGHPELRGGSPAVDVFAEAAELYAKKYLAGQKDPHTTTILYPGSGVDTDPLVFGLSLLHTTPVKRVDFVFTEIGDENVAYYPGQSELKASLDKELERLTAAELLYPFGSDVVSHGTRTFGDKTYPVVDFKYSFIVPVCISEFGSVGGCTGKQLTLTVTYNGAPNRKVLTADEKKYFDAGFVRDATGRYWDGTERSDAFQPSFARDDQFAAADVIVSCQSGDRPLLQLDYLRALRKASAKQRVVITEDAANNYALGHPFPGFRTELTQLRNRHLGYSKFPEVGAPGLVALIPERNK